MAAVGLAQGSLCQLLSVSTALLQLPEQSIPIPTNVNTALRHSFPYRRTDNIGPWKIAWDEIIDENEESEICSSLGPITSNQEGAVLLIAGSVRSWVHEVSLGGEILTLKNGKSEGPYVIDVSGATGMHGDLVNGLYISHVDHMVNGHEEYVKLLDGSRLITRGKNGRWNMQVI